MTLLLPLLLGLLLGPFGAVIGLLVGLLSDEVLYAVFIVRAAQALATGRPFRFFPGLPQLAIAELGLLLMADQTHDQTVFIRYQLAREWLESGPYRLKNRRFMAQIARIWTGLHQVAAALDLDFLIARVIQRAGPERRHDLFLVLVRCCAADADGTDQADLVWLYRLALAMDLPVLAFHQGMTSNFCLQREACAILGLAPHSGRDQLMAVAHLLPPPETQSAEALIRRQAFAVIEDQLDALERVAERYRQATIREQR